jgi:hypothetical protein
MDTTGEIERGAFITNPHVLHDNIALQLPLAQSLSALCFCCLQQSFFIFAAQQDAVP